MSAADLFVIDSYLVYSLQRSHFGGSSLQQTETSDRFQEAVVDIVIVDL